MKHAFMDQDRWGAYRFNSQAFAAAIAPFVGGVMIPKDDPDEWRGRVKIGDLQLCIHAAGYGANKHRAEVSIYAPEIENKLNHREVRWPSCTVDPARPIEKIAAELKRKVIEPATPLLEKVKGQLSGQLGKRAALEKLAAEITASFPKVSVTFRDPQATEAQLYLNGGGPYLSGRLQSDGWLYVDRVGSLDGGRLMRFLAALAEPANG